MGGEPEHRLPGMDDELLQRHAQRIAEQLRREQRELDAREAEFNARVAQMEAEWRSSRLRHWELEQELATREATLQEQARHLSERSADLAAAELARKTDAQTSDRSVPQSASADLQQTLEQWQTRLRELDVQERQLQAQFADLASDQTKLTAERKDLLVARQRHHDQTQSDVQQARDTSERMAQELLEREDELDRRRQAVVRMHEDISRMYRGAIETHICLETLWQRLQESGMTAVRTAQLAELRRNLADEFQLAERFLQEERQELQRGSQTLAAGTQQLAAKERDLRAWHYRRQQESDDQAQQLLDRELQLQQQQAQFRQSETAHEQHRRSCEAELRRLRRMLQLD